MYSFTAYIPDERPGCYSPCEKKDFFRLNELVGLVTHRMCFLPWRGAWFRFFLLKLVTRAVSIFLCCCLIFLCLLPMAAPWFLALEPSCCVWRVHASWLFYRFSLFAVAYDNAWALFMFETFGEEPVFASNPRGLKLAPLPLGRLSTAQCIEGSRRSTVISLAILVQCWT